ncbi:MFS transporter [Allokutzneria albata]|uniref:Predicted arabinose efflux permease, MFS family n=1 Tax=Allokutzneria albata TaxID=211114 RepID=A0A1G9SPL7_ALLAB|nr:MFS transporter [Allokutzneria albata]SDM37324.1 Predicted arabinose efflux permease, MFS family [Allokutzneria albata]
MSRLLPQGPLRVLAIAQLANSVGDGAFYACSALFFTRVAGLSPTQVGLALTLGWATAMVAGVPLGALADRWGPRRTAVVLSVAVAGTLSAVLFVRSFPLVVLVVCGYACCQAGLGSARQTLLAALVPPAERTAARAHLQSTLNVGLALGAGLGALVLWSGTYTAYVAAFSLDAASFLLAAFVLRKLPPTPPPPPVTSTPEPRLGVLRDRPYAVVTLLNAIMCLNMPLLSLGLPMWVAQRTDAPAPVSAMLLALNMLGVVAFQVRMARQVTGLRTATRATGRAGWLMLAACAVYALSGFDLGAGVAVAVLVVAAVIQVFGEMLHGAGSWEIGFALAPPDRQGQYQGFFGMGPQIARMLGPVLLTALLIGGGAVGWLVLGGLFLLAGLAFAPAVRSAQRRLSGRAESVGVLGE